VPSHELSLVPGLVKRHRDKLARLHITDLPGLAAADPEALHSEMAKMQPPPTLQEIEGWQAYARSRLAEAVGAAEAGGTAKAADTAEAAEVPYWQTVASFMVFFQHSQADDDWLRRVQVERTEVEPERPTKEWPAWDYGPVWAWMHGQLGLADDTEPNGGNGRAEAAPAGDQAAGAESPAPTKAAGRSPLRIDSAAIIDATGQRDVVQAGVLTADLPAELVSPVQVMITVGAAPSTEVLAVTRILRPDGPGWNPRDPVVVPASGRAEFDLSEVPLGEHRMRLIAWAPDATASPVSITLPPVTIRAGSY